MFIQFLVCVHLKPYANCIFFSVVEYNCLVFRLYIYIYNVDLDLSVRQRHFMPLLNLITCEWLDGLKSHRCNFDFLWCFNCLPFYFRLAWFICLYPNALMLYTHSIWLQIRANGFFRFERNLLIYEWLSRHIKPGNG